MKILRDASIVQKEKTNGTCTEQKAYAASCNGECWDCDNCGGSITH